MMSRKDYVKFAELFSTYYADPHPPMTNPETVAYFFSMRVADLFAEDNGRFDRERFIGACCGGAE